MLSYLHGFHAGNFADVQKHAGLTLATRMMQVKTTPIAFFDTHGGSAMYALNSEQARKTSEADTGIQRVWSSRDRLSEDWTPLLEMLDERNEAGKPLVSYPGSPQWVSHHLRKGDHLTVWELHSTESSRLAEWGEGNSAVSVIQGDGLAGLLKKLPPSQPRLLTLMDPSYEIKEDYLTVADTLIKAWKKCRHGVFLLWYPLLPQNNHQKLLASLLQSPLRKVYRHELTLGERPERGMAGTGLLVVNPPWGFAERFEAMMASVCDDTVLNVKQFSEWLIGE